MRLRISDRLSVPRPCHFGWDQMQGDERRRFCAHCQEHVHNLSTLTEREIGALLRRTNGSLCGGFELDSLGRKICQPERGWRGWIQRRHSLAQLFVSSVMAAILALPVTAGETRFRGTKSSPVGPTGGKHTDTPTAAANPIKPTTESAGQANFTVGVTRLGTYGVMTVKPSPPRKKWYKK